MERSTLDALDAVDAAAAEIAYRVPLAAAADLVHHEARVLDQRQPATWLDLFTEDAWYWVAATHAATKPGESTDPLVLDRAGLATRYSSVASDGDDGDHAGVEPVTCRILADIHPVASDEAWDGAPPCHIVVGSTFSLAVVTAGGEQQVLYGWARHGLRRGEDRRLRIAAKRVVILGSQKAPENPDLPL